MRLAIIGNGIVGNMAALYYQKILPDSVDIIVIGPEDRGGLPLVGESTIEITGNFLEEQLGLQEYLHEHQVPKYALTYYFKLDPTNPEDRTYSVHGTESAPEDLHPLADQFEKPHPISWQINRHTFDPYLQDMVTNNEAIRRVYGLVRDIDLAGVTGHMLQIEKEDGENISLQADWVIDATGRNRLLGKKLDLTVKPAGQRDCFWFRLDNYDRSLLKELNALGPTPPGPDEPGHYDRYYSTHHFMAHGNWIWMIPLKHADGSDLMSIGFVSHPDHFDGDVRSMDDFMDYVSTVHPVVTDFVKSGNVLDTNLLRRYHYVTSKVYSADRWAIVGDAAFAPDPLFSNGLAFCILQLEQLGAMLQADCEGTLTEEYVNELSDAFMVPVLSSQETITKWYPFMDDPLLSSMKINWIETVYFYMFLPLVINRCHYDPARMRMWKALQIRKTENVFDIPDKLVTAREKVAVPHPDNFVYKGAEKVNPMAMHVVDDLSEINDQLANGSKILARYVDAVIERAEGPVAIP